MKATNYVVYPKVYVCPTEGYASARPILRTGVNLGTSADQAYSRCQEGEAILLGFGMDNVHYVDVAAGSEPVIVDRPAMEVVITRDTVAADGIETASLVGMPRPCLVRVESDVYEVPDGRLDISFDLPGVYKLRVEAFPYLPADFEVTAI